MIYLDGTVFPKKEHVLTGTLHLFEQVSLHSRVAPLKRTCVFQITPGIPKMLKVRVIEGAVSIFGRYPPSSPVVGVCCVEGEAIVVFVYLYVVDVLVTCVDVFVNVSHER